MEKTRKIAVVGLSKRGHGLIKEAILPACEDYNIEIAAVYDPYLDRTEQAAATVKERTGKEPIKAKDYQEIWIIPKLTVLSLPAHGKLIFLRQLAQ